ncbi:PREDICTED: sulfotransferase 6B1-like, partial [Mesitornis unicolor]|uniref:sulfotransferase 6B1-like n=1 Tax=Mesitornis unicolor TaxID=54374 RepID=UPI0005293B35
MAEDKKTFVDEINKVLAKSEGLTLKDLLFSYQGIPYPVTVCSAETFKALENLEARRDDVVLVSYPKCIQILVLFRNPKDTAVSFFHFHNSVPSIPSYSSWDEFFSEFMNGR